MEWSKRIIMQLPVQQLWTDDGAIDSIFQRDLSTTDIRELLRLGPVHFVFLNLGDKPLWVPLAQCFVYWKHEIQPHIVNSERVYLEDFPGEYCYFASEWSAVDEVPIIALQKYH